MKRLQNKIAESGLTLPITAIYAICVWAIAIFGGSPSFFSWPQMACYVAASYMMVELNNSNALLRVRSRMVATMFIFLSCMYISGFQSLLGSISLIGFIMTIILLFNTYQDNLATGKTFYAFLFLSLCSLIYLEYLYYIPLFWVLMASRLQSFGWRTLAASIIGLITPYWFASLWLILRWDFTPMTDHLSEFGHFIFPIDYSSLSVEQLTIYIFLVIISGVGIIHFWQYSYEDKIRIRQLFGFFTAVNIATLLFIALQPHLYDHMIRPAIVCASPIVAHFFTMTSHRFTNIAFIVFLVTCTLITITNLWMHF
ncbi:hypothetical protein [Prevotella sp. E2-28]|uniref:hypothetical protein n=1 Tax=Prevotella sp. E2-28 TaxID=2913620 RepID=UPI001EDAB012|nr:hypothetical protein [Prevotella sp. E2-28]UKK53135.1 hypothetical protein L6465_11160 [Prevotella sp. E2-28]